MANTENKQKKKKPSNQQHKTVYFNTKNVNDVKLFEYAQSVGVRNFSGWIKNLIYQEMIRRNGMPPNPYEYATLPTEPIDVPAPAPRSIPVAVKQAEVEPIQYEEIESVDQEETPVVESKAQKNSGIEINLNGKKVKAKSLASKGSMVNDESKQEESPATLERDQLETVSETNNDSNKMDDKEEEQTVDTSNRSAAARNFLQGFGKK